MEGKTALFLIHIFVSSTCVMITVCLGDYITKNKSEVVPKEYKKVRKHSWSFGYGGMMPDANQTNAMKSHLMVI